MEYPLLQISIVSFAKLTFYFIELFIWKLLSCKHQDVTQHFRSPGYIENKDKSGLGSGGMAYGDTELSTMYLGSGGGSGGNAKDLKTNPTGLSYCLKVKNEFLSYLKQFVHNPSVTKRLLLDLDVFGKVTKCFWSCFKRSILCA